MTLTKISNISGIRSNCTYIKKEETTLCYARVACDTMMHKFAAADLPPKGHFYYHQGVFLSGGLKTWQLTGEQKYLDYAASWVHAVLNCTPFVRQYDILSNKWGVLLCQKEYQTNDIRRSSREWL